MSLREEINSIWAEKYRPQSLEDMVLTTSMRESMNGYLTSGEIPNLLFIGNPGTGKTTLAKVLIRSLDAEYLYINASERNGIDEVRGSISNFAQTKSFNGKKKIIFLDEFDSFTDQGQRALRNIMEEYSFNTRFILTGNYVHRIILPIQSRCQIYTEFAAPIKDYSNRVKKILLQESVQIESDQVELIKETIRLHYPDLRKIIQTIQKNTIQGVLKIRNLQDHSEFAQQVLDQLLDKTEVCDVRKFVIEKEISFSNDYPRLLKDLFNCVYRANILQDKKRVALLHISEHLYRCSFVMDQEINFFACLIHLSEVL